MAKRRTQLEWTEIAVKVLQDRAQEAGLLGVDERLVYTAPDRKAGTDAEIAVYTDYGKQTKPFWLPTVLPKDTNRTVERLVDVAAQVLYSLSLQTSFNRAVDKQD